MLNKSAIHSILQAYPHLSTIEHYHLRKRLGWCPYDKISELVPPEGVRLDIGCGHGHFLVAKLPNLVLSFCPLIGEKARSTLGPDGGFAGGSPVNGRRTMNLTAKRVQRLRRQLGRYRDDAVPGLLLQVITVSY